MKLFTFLFSLSLLLSPICIPSSFAAKPKADTAEVNSESSRMYLGALLGLSNHNISGSANRNVQINYGARFGLNTFSLGDFATLAFGLHFDRFSVALGSSSTASRSYMNVLFQILFRNISHSGFYAGPEIGLGLASLHLSGSTTSNSSLSYGGVLGYDYQASNLISFGPEVHYDSYSAVSNNPSGLSTFASSAYKILGAITFHFE